MANKINNRYFGQTGGSPSTIPVRVYNGSSVVEGYIANQVGARRFKCVDDTTITDNTSVLTVGQQYVIVSIGDSDWTAAGALDNKVGRLFTATAVNGGGSTGTVYAVYTAKLVAGTSFEPTVANTATLVGLVNGSQPVTLRKINSRTASDFSGNRYKWSLSDDSTQTVLLLTAI